MLTTLCCLLWLKQNCDCCWSDTAEKIQELFNNSDKTHTMSADGKNNAKMQHFPSRKFVSSSLRRCLHVAGCYFCKWRTFTYVKEIKSRLTKAREANASLAKFWKNHGISAKIRPWKALVMAMYTVLQCYCYCYCTILQYYSMTVLQFYSFIVLLYYSTVLLCCLYNDAIYTVAARAGHW